MTVGLPQRTTGVIGALGLDNSAGDVMPHERTLAKAKSDRLELLRATRANLDPIWGLSLAFGLSALLAPSGEPYATATDDEGVRHSLWRVTDPAHVRAIADAVGSARVVLADGHHRFETAGNYRAERRAAGIDDRGAGRDHDPDRRAGALAAVRAGDPPAADRHPRRRSTRRTRGTVPGTRRRSQRARRDRRARGRHA